MSLPRTAFVTMLVSLWTPGVAAQESPCLAQLEPLRLVADPTSRLQHLREAPLDARDVLRDALQCRPVETPIAGSRWRVRWAAPSVVTEWNTALADPRGEGALWAGRGLSASVSTGVLVDVGSLHVAIVPQIWGAQNTAFEIQPSPNGDRSSYASPYYSGAMSMDLPSRMGADALVAVTPGQSAAWITALHWDIGWSSSEQQWGPGLDGLILGRNSSGVPRAFVRTERPFVNRIGSWSGVAFMGRLTESRFFDREPSNDSRSLSAIAIAWSPPSSTLFTLSIARAIMAERDPQAAITDQLFSVLRPVHREGSDEMSAVSARLQLPSGRMRAWAEVAHQGPVKFRALLVSPLANLGYRMGVERGVERRTGAWLFLAEAANVEQSHDILDFPQHDFYAGYGTLQGWTQRGQLLGDGVGPGGQSQFVSADWVAGSWRLGTFAERIRRNEDALLREYLPYPNRHDVEARGGIRLGFTQRDYTASVQFSAGKRINYLFQNTSFIPDFRTADVAMQQVVVAIAPRFPWIR